MSDEPAIMITAADVSGDAHAARLIEALRRRLGRVRFVGVGGEQMASAGCELLSETTRRAAMLGGALWQAVYFLGVIRRLAGAMDEHRPDVVVPVDSPAMNWHVARSARRRGVPVVYYIAPQVWAWAPWRVRKLRRLTDAVACILPFEPAHLRPRGVNARYVGHPLFDSLAPPEPPDLDSARRSGRWRVALLPGSRQAEIAAHAPALAEVMDCLRQRYPLAEFTFAVPTARAAETARRASGREQLAIEIGRTTEVLGRSHLALAASGTVTLEAAYFGVPMVIFYRVSRLGYHLLGRWLIRTRFLSLVNILAGEQLVPELMPWFGDAGQLLRQAEGLLADPDRLKRTRQALLALTAPLRVRPPATAADNAADLVIKAMRSAGPARGRSAGSPAI